MALLTSPWWTYLSRSVGLGVGVAWLVAGCSFVLDPDELRAELRPAGDTSVDTAPEHDTDTVEVLEVADTKGDSEPDTDTTVQDTDIEDTEPADVTEPTDVDEDTHLTDVDEDTWLEDTEPGDTAEPEDTADTEPEDTRPLEDTRPVDTGPVTQLVVETSGAGNCILDFYVQGLTSCPKTCGWTLVFDARKSTGISSFSWRLSVNNGYLITPSTITGPVASVVISTPACLFFPAASMRPANVTADVSLDGGPWVRAAVLPFTTRQVTTCGASLCPSP